MEGKLQKAHGKQLLWRNSDTVEAIEAVEAVEDADETVEAIEAVEDAATSGLIDGFHTDSATSIKRKSGQHAHYYEVSIN